MHHPHGGALTEARSRGAHRGALTAGAGCSGAGARSGWRPSVLVLAAVLARPADDDLILLDRHLDRAVAGPILRVDGIVLDRRVKPKAVALLPVVEGGLKHAGWASATPAPTTASAPAALLALLGIAIGPGPLLGLLALLLLGLRAPRLGRLQFGGDQGLILGPQIDLVVVVAGQPHPLGGSLVEVVLALEGLDLLHGHLQLMGDPGVGASLADPGADAIQFRSE